MIQHRRYAALGIGDSTWLKARYHFALSPGGNPDHAPLGPLVVWNDDEIAPGRGFPFHLHANMEIITCVLEGTLSHRDNLGNGGQIKAGDVQVISAGTGIKHEELSSGRIAARVFQIWVEPRGRGGAPAWGTKRFPKTNAARFTVLASGFDDAGALAIRADARVLGATARAGQSISYDLAAGHVAYLVPSTGTIRLNGELVDAGDGAAVRDETALRIDVIDDTELVVVDAASTARP